MVKSKLRSLCLTIGSSSRSNTWSLDGIQAQLDNYYGHIWDTLGIHHQIDSVPVHLCMDRPCCKHQLTSLHSLMAPHGYQLWIHFSVTVHQKWMWQAICCLNLRFLKEIHKLLAYTFPKLQPEYLTLLKCFHHRIWHNHNSYQRQARNQILLSWD